jgi:succinate-semialdehyde dehydrogenase / glutarate-semialdehyde dehydrogenase
MGPLANPGASRRLRISLPMPRPKVHVILTGGGRIRNRGYFFPLTVLPEVLDDARVIPRPNSGSPLMRFQG